MFKDLFVLKYYALSLAANPLNEFFIAFYSQD